MKLVSIYHDGSPVVVVETFSEAGERVKRAAYHDVTPTSIQRMANVAHDHARHVRPFMSRAIGYVAVFAAYCQPVSEADLARLF